MRESLRASSGYLSPRIAGRRTGSFGGGTAGRGTSTSGAAGGSTGSVVGAPPTPGLVAPLSDAQALSDMLMSSYFNFLLVCVPLGWAAEYFKWGAVPIFFFNFTALIPLALVLGQLTEDLALRYGERSFLDFRCVPCSSEIPSSIEREKEGCSRECERGGKEKTAFRSLFHSLDISSLILPPTTTLSPPPPLK